MDTLIKSKTTTNDLNTIIKGHLEELAKATDKARVSEEMVRYLEFCAKFHQYSPSNIWLILMAKPEATHVAGYTAWKKLGRYVKQGEKGIKILAPHFWKEEDREGNEKERIGFHVTNVFDVSQTDGESLAEQPNWKSPEKNRELQNKLIDFAESNGIKVTIEPLSGETQGVSMGGRIVLSPEAGVKTLVHEIAHELLHQVEKDQFSRQIKEMEAESIAYVVCSYFGLLNLSSPNYLALHGFSNDEIMNRFQRIISHARSFILMLEGENR
jgi:hypothetical protein